MYVISDIGIQTLIREAKDGMIQDKIKDKQNWGGKMKSSSNDDISVPSKGTSSIVVGQKYYYAIFIGGTIMALILSLIVTKYMYHQK
jgi:hypothetical protein